MCSMFILSFDGNSCAQSVNNDKKKTEKQFSSVLINSGYWFTYTDKIYNCSRLPGRVGIIEYNDNRCQNESNDINTLFGWCLKIDIGVWHFIDLDKIA